MIFEVLILFSEIEIDLPFKCIFAPSFFKNLIKSIISGSIAQFLRMVIPFAKHAAIIVFSVAPTLIFENLILCEDKLVPRQ